MPATGPQINPVATMAQWHTYRIRTSLIETQVFIDDQLVRTFPRFAHQLGRPLGFVGGLYFSYGDLAASIDWIKITDLKGDTAMFEDFLHPDSLTKVKKKFLYQDGNCESNFVAYYNNLFSSSYNFAQLDSLYWHDFKVELDVCASYGTKLELKTVREEFRQSSSLDSSSEACVVAFADFFNTRRQESLSFSQIKQFYNNHRVLLDICGSSTFFPSTATLCGNPQSAFVTAPFPGGATCKDSSLIAVGVGTVLYNYYRDSLINSFDEQYLAKCLAAKSIESFTVTDTTSEYHYTLYYYDQAGNLVKTVPPAGVDESKFGHMIAWSDSVKLARKDRQLLTPDHIMPTQYRYNTLNQVVAQHSPDGGKSLFWYDLLGRLAISQNAKQYAASGTELNRLYSYTQYDFLGRITEVGQIKNSSSDAMTDNRSRSSGQLSAWITASATGKTQITSTYYDTRYAGLANGAIISQTNLRNRVSYTSFTASSNPAQFNQATFYAYDIHGNVRQLTQDYGVASGITANMMNARSNRFKSIHYQYDLISGKVNEVAYEPGFKDAWYHRYDYDAENRITKVETSVNGFHWEMEARYEYYRHGPLARTILGNQHVQGIDYAYTLQGWLKGVNSTNLSADHDMGNDGSLNPSQSSNKFTARDAFGFSLNYFGGDYQAITGQIKFPEPMGYFPAQEYRPLYNGNISSMAESIDKMSTSGLFGGKTMLYNYKYDQLNRITGMDAYNNFNVANNNWNGMVKLDQYQERVSYDANGNIQKYLRHGNLTAGSLRMDSLTYVYDALKRNRLLQVKDAVAPTVYGTYRDLDNQTAANNYVYDEIGNIVEDKSENITSVVWSVYGKILEINRTSTSNNPVTKIVYTYDAQGNRISSVTTKSNTTNRDYVWYIRDAQGNSLGVYKATGGTNLSSLYPALSEHYIYGSSRLGSYHLETSVREGSEQMRYVYDYAYRRGLRNYELSNHLGNVLTTISDKKFGVPSSSNSSLIDYYTADVTNATSYYPFGSIMPGRTWSNGGKYRYGFNGKENDNNVKNADGTQQDYGFRIYDPRTGRFLSIDPLTKAFPWYTPYQFAGNKPTQYVDLDGLEEGKTDVQSSAAYNALQIKANVTNTLIRLSPQREERELRTAFEKAGITDETFINNYKIRLRTIVTNHPADEHTAQAWFEIENKFVVEPKSTFGLETFETVLDVLGFASVLPTPGSTGFLAARGSGQILVSEFRKSMGILMHVRRRSTIGQTRDALPGVQKLKDIMDAGMAFVGKNAKEIRTAKGKLEAFESTDGLRRFRPPTNKSYGGGTIQANFEQRVNKDIKWEGKATEAQRSNMHIFSDEVYKP